jgi:predicted choloylglycine hydrolase
LHQISTAKEGVEGFRDIKIGRQALFTQKYAGDLELLAKTETVMQDMIDSLNETGWCYGMEMN